MRVTVLSVPDCPNRDLADARLRQALAQAGLPGVVVEHRQVTTQDQAVAEQFHGSPTIQLDGEDLFAAPGIQVSLSCRLYVTEHGVAGAPTVAELATALIARLSR